MGTVAQIGPSISIKGELRAEEPLTIAGRVDGTIDVSGHPLTVTESATVEADIMAHTIVIAGTVAGHLSAAERIVVQQTASLSGEISAPALTVQDGATVEGKFEITGSRQPVTLKLAV